MDGDVFFDACVIINLFASEKLREVLSAISTQSVVCSAVADEAITIRNEDPNQPDLVLPLTELVDRGVFAQAGKLSPEEEELYVDLAAVLDDGEAMSMALAISREGVLVTDDKKARGEFLRRTGDTRRLLATSDLLRSWVEATGVDRPTVVAMLQRIRQQAHFIPGNSDPNYDWWISFLRDA